MAARGGRISMPLIRPNAATGADAQVPRSRRKSVAGPLVRPCDGRAACSISGAAPRGSRRSKGAARIVWRRAECCVCPARS